MPAFIQVFTPCNVNWGYDDDQSAHITRGITNDLARSLDNCVPVSDEDRRLECRHTSDGGWALKFIQMRAICPASLGANCRYRARYELSTTYIDGKQTYAHRYVVIGPTGVRQEGLIVSTTADGRYLFYRRSGGIWAKEFPGNDSIAAMYVAMLFDITRDSKGLALVF